LTGAFFFATIFLATGFFLATIFLTGAFFFATIFLATGFFLATIFLTGAFFFATIFLAIFLTAIFFDPKVKTN
jgi:hypothetical protein